MNWCEQHEKHMDSHHLASILVELAVQRGADRDALLRGTGLFIADLTQAHQKVSFEQLDLLISHIQKRVNSQDMSFMLGRRLLRAGNNPINSLIMNARHLNQALRFIQCFQAQLCKSVFLTVKRHQHKTYFILNSAMAHNANQVFWFEFVLSAISSASKLLHGNTLPFEYYFNQPRVRNIYQYEANLGHRLHFDQPLNMLVIEDQYLNLPVANRSQAVAKQLLWACKKQRGSQNQIGLIQAVCLLIKKQQGATLEQVADALTMSPATLKRKLKCHGTRFQQLQDNMKKQQAIFDLTIRGNANAQVAEALKFNDLTNFRRAFKRWTGQTPSEIKNDIKSEIKLS